jgi:drug/metabolite transporter (DMT)-like permease
MIYIVLTVLTSVFLLSLFKLFSRFRVNTFHAIVVNYFTAAVTGIIFSEGSFSFAGAQTSGWIFLCIPLGFLFIAVFYLISLTTQRISISAASVANKMSVVMPVMFSIFIIGDKFTFLKFIGIILALIAVYLTTRVRKEEKPDTTAQWWLPVLVFIGSGCIDISINAAKQYYLKSLHDEELFTVFTFGSAFFVGALLLFFQLLSSKTAEVSKTSVVHSFIGGIILGIPNYFSIFFIIKALDSDVLSSLELFPVLNISNVVLSAMIGVLLFKERLSAMNGFGIALAIASIALVSM